MNWQDVVPPSVARRQNKWETRRAAFLMWRAGLSMRQIAVRMNKSERAAYELIRRFNVTVFKNQVSPVEEYFKMGGDISALAGRQASANRNKTSLCYGLLGSADEILSELSALKS